MSTPPTILIISQVYVPDPAAVGQHIADAAAELAARGYRVKVLASANGYDDPSRKYPLREVLDGVQVRRLRFSSFGKKSIPVRLLGQSLFLAQAFVHGLFTRRMAGMMVSTSPPFCSVIAYVISMVRRVPVTYWVMDLNPDQMIALGKIGPRSLPARVFDLFNRMILRRAKDVVVLDRFMAGRVAAKLDVAAKTSVMPPWPHETEVQDIPHDQNPFRKSQGLEGKFVIMYSGNHGPSNPITTLLAAAKRLSDVPELVFMFIGGGIGKREVDEAIRSGATNVRSLPYQPLSEIKWSLSAADVHLVTMGNEVVGIIHPCKVYGAMAVSRPVLLCGPTPSHVADLIDQHGIGWKVAHGDVDGAVATIRQILATSAEQRREMGRRAAAAIASSLGRIELRRRFCDVVVRGLPSAR